MGTCVMLSFSESGFELQESVNLMAVYMDA